MDERRVKKKTIWELENSDTANQYRGGCGDSLKGKFQIQSETKLPRVLSENPNPVSIKLLK
jgi:hypothetical protein